MNIEITDEMIEKIIREQVKARVNTLIAEKARDNPYWLWDMCKDSINWEVQKVVTPNLIEETCKEFTQNNIAEKVVDRFAEKIRESFEY
jgi:transcriptional accessory protein Tex/SPT6